LKGMQGDSENINNGIARVFLIGFITMFWEFMLVKKGISINQF
jgi:hypothetical protein